MAHFFRIGPGEMQRQCFRRGQHISMSGKLQLRYKPPPERAAPLNSNIQLHRYPAQPLNLGQGGYGRTHLGCHCMPFRGRRRARTTSYAQSRWLGRWRWGGPPHRLRRRRSPQEAVEQGMRRRPIPEPRRLHQSVKQILPSVGHGRLSNLTPIKVPVERSAETNENNPGLPIRF
jgi:hypothetical protein